jgi:hypothetical protein
MPKIESAIQSLLSGKHTKHWNMSVADGLVHITVFWGGKDGREFNRMHIGKDPELTAVRALEALKEAKAAARP